MPSGKRTTTPPDIHEIKITLLGIEPPIWRRFAVPCNRSLAVLHDFIQAVMGWRDCHLRMFQVGGRRYSSDYQEMTAEWEARAGQSSWLVGRPVRRTGMKPQITYRTSNDGRYRPNKTRRPDVTPGHRWTGQRFERAKERAKEAADGQVRAEGR